MNIRPRATSTKSKSGYGRMEPTDPRLRIIAEAADRLGQKRAAEQLGISNTLVRRAMQVHGVAPRPIGWHMHGNHNRKPVSALLKQP